MTDREKLKQLFCHEDMQKMISLYKTWFWKGVVLCPLLWGLLWLMLMYDTGMDSGIMRMSTLISVITMAVISVLAVAGMLTAWRGLAGIDRGLQQDTEFDIRKKVRLLYISEGIMILAGLVTIFWEVHQAMNSGSGRKNQFSYYIPTIILCTLQVIDMALSLVRIPVFKKIINAYEGNADCQYMKQYKILLIMICFFILSHAVMAVTMEAVFMEIRMADRWRIAFGDGSENIKPPDDRFQIPSIWHILR